VQGEFVALHTGPRFSPDVRLPRVIISGLKCVPPGEDRGTEQDNRACFTPETPNEYKKNEKSNRQQNGDNLVAVAKWRIKPDGTEAPGSTDESNNSDCQSSDAEADLTQPGRLSGAAIDSCCCHFRG
jgi:hypothetical protein